MHLGNVFAALMSWLSARLQGGEWLLRIEDLDPQRSKREYAEQLQEDLHRLGLDWDEGGLEDTGGAGPYRQSLRGEIYGEALRRLEATGLTYPCHCTRADLRATQAPHASDGRVIYPGTCRPSPHRTPDDRSEKKTGPAAVRLIVPDQEMVFDDRLFGPQRGNLATDCGDFVLRRADGAWAYQLAVVVDDIAMGVTEVVRGCDLMASTFQQLYLYRLFGAEPPAYMHIPLICNAAGQRLSKRDASLSLDELLRVSTPEAVIGRLAHISGLSPTPAPLSTSSLLDYLIEKLEHHEKIPIPCRRHIIIDPRRDGGSAACRQMALPA